MGTRFNEFLLAQGLRYSTNPQPGIRHPKINAILAVKTKHSVANAAARPSGHGFTPLASPLPITAQVWPEGTQPWVSICSIAYNHGEFIERCLQGMLQQRTTFPVEIRIHDDASTDGTAKTIREYAARYPQLIKATLQSENQYSQGKRAFPQLFKDAQGRFIALCEGDDFWTCCDKLQIQADYLNENPGVSLCFHDVKVMDEAGDIVDDSMLATAGALNWIYSKHDMIAGKQIPTLAVMFVNKPLHFSPEYHQITNEDVYIFAMLSRYGVAHRVAGIMGAYQLHSGGVWTSASDDKRRYSKVISRRAIARAIDPEDRSYAAYRYGILSFNCMVSEIKAVHPRRATDCFRHYLAGIGRCVTGISFRPSGLATTLEMTARLVAAPVVHIARGLRRVALRKSG